MRQIDILKTTLETIEHLEFELSQSLNADLTHNKKSIEIKNRIDALRYYVCSTVKASIMRQPSKVA